MASSEVAVAPSATVEQFLNEFAGAPVGLEDVGAGDVAMSKITIVHDEAVFLDSLTGEKYDSLDTVLLGLVKGRVLWSADLDSNDGPMCRSRDAVIGTPEPNFPTGFFTEKEGVYNADGTVTCKTCPMAQWGSNPKNDTPWCTEQMTFPLTLPGSDDAAGLITFQRSGLTAARGYISGFVREHKPMFMNRTTITLEKGKKGTVIFSTPKFVRGEAITDVDLLRSYAEQYKAIKSVIGSATDSPSAAVVPPAATPSLVAAQDADAPF